MIAYLVDQVHHALYTTPVLGWIRKKKVYPRAFWISKRHYIPSGHNSPSTPEILLPVVRKLARAYLGAWFRGRNA